MRYSTKRAMLVAAAIAFVSGCASSHEDTSPTTQPTKLAQVTILETSLRPADAAFAVANAFASCGFKLRDSQGHWDDTGYLASQDRFFARAEGMSANERPMTCTAEWVAETQTKLTISTALSADQHAYAMRLVREQIEGATKEMQLQKTAR